MKKLTCVYLENPSTPYKAQIVTGRCRLFAVLSGSELIGGVSSIAPQVKLYNGTDTTELLVQLSDTVNTIIGVPYGSQWCIDLPANGILFDSGIYFEGHEKCQGISLFISGGVSAA